MKAYNALKREALVVIGILITLLYLAVLHG